MAGGRSFATPAPVGPSTLWAPRNPGYLEFKYTVDVVVAFLVFVLTLPLLALLTLLVKLTSPGPAFFKQKRVGKNGRIFEILKVRTMKLDAEAETGPIWARERDPRVTGIGAFLRKTHLDELPQAINVLRGDMSLIGPRPERPYFTETFRHRIRQYDRRFAVRPGITGLAQVLFKSSETEEDVRRKTAYDMLYIRRMCWLIDLSIIFLTIGRLTGRGAR
jgi:lipopolysaccharide/colanic/teichoic acid biosynthesis glycosyltransferase